MRTENGTKIDLEEKESEAYCYKVTFVVFESVRRSSETVEGEDEMESNVVD